MEWPILYKDILRVGSLDCHVGVCSLWTERALVEKLLDKRDYCVIGNLYSASGINAIIRNVFANPRVRTIVLWGAELSLSGQCLLQLMKEGVEVKGRRIKDSNGEIEPEIPLADVDLFRQKIEVVDLRGKPAEALKQRVKELAKEKKERFLRKPKLFAKTEPKVSFFPSEQTGFRVIGDKVAKTWLRLLNEIMKYGRAKRTRYSQDNELKEILNLTAVVTAEDPDQVYFPKYLPFSQKELRSYYAELMTARKIPGVSYNYGRRLRKDLGVNQILKMKRLLRERPASKKMLAVTTKPKLDWSRVNQGDTPCLTQILGSVQDKKFFLTAHFRSQDMVHGWPRNTFGLRRLQQDIAAAGGYQLGPLTMITHSAHIYSDDFKLVENLLSEWYEAELGFTAAVHFEFDPRGNVVIEVIKEKEALVWPDWRQRHFETEPIAVKRVLRSLAGKGKLIRATLYAPEGGPALKVFEGRTAQEVAWQMSDWQYLVLPSHLLYIGLELQKAETAIIGGKAFQQDPA